MSENALIFLLVIILVPFALIMEYYRWKIDSDIFQSISQWLEEKRNKQKNSK